MELCMQMYGEYHILTSRLYINIGIVYEDNNDYRKAYSYFKRWARVSEEILGPEHPKTQRAKGVLRESRYRRIAQDLGEWDAYEDTDDNNDDNADDDDGEDEENADLEHNYDDVVNVVNIQMLTSQDEVQLGSNVWGDNNESAAASLSAAGANENLNGGSVSEVVMNGFVEEEQDGEEEDTSTCEENTDTENLYDDNFEDYDEQYILNSESGPVFEEFNTEEFGLNLDDDYEVSELASLTLEDCDNRFAPDSHEEDNDRMWFESVAWWGHNNTSCLADVLIGCFGNAVSSSVSDYHIIHCLSGKKKKKGGMSSQLIICLYAYLPVGIKILYELQFVILILRVKLVVWTVKLSSLQTWE